VILALIVALVIETQTEIISDEPVLAALMPIIALIGGNGGNQSLAVMIRSMASDDVPPAQVPGILGRQTGVGVLNGLAVGTLTALACWLLISAEVFDTDTDPAQIAIVVGISGFAVLVVGTLAGSGIPVVLRKLGLDPALASSIFLTLLTDIVGFGGFLLMAAWLL
jgi:magnesium transporter